MVTLRRRDDERQPTLSGAPLFILMSLATEDKHGHALMKDIEQFAGVRLGPGTLYKAISRLEEDGLVAALPPDDRRRPYALTPAGRTVLMASIDYLGSVVEEGRARLRLVPGIPDSDTRVTLADADDEAVAG